jgi:hypothetical protein
MMGRMGPHPEQLHMLANERKNEVRHKSNRAHEFHDLHVPEEPVVSTNELPEEI